MNENIKKIHAKFDALQQREQVMVAGLLFVLLIVAWQILMFDESTIKVTKLNNQIKTQQQQNSSLKIEIAAYKDRAVNNPNVKLKREQQQHLNEIEILDNKLNKKMKGLINPKKMTAMLKDIFKSNTNITLVSLEKLKTQSLFNFTGENTPENSNTESNALNVINTSVTDDVSGEYGGNSAVVYQHPVKIVFTGSYLNAMNYLETIERMPWDLYWDTVQLDVEKYPKSRVVITVFTLSLKKGWVGV